MFIRQPSSSEYGCKIYVAHVENHYARLKLNTFYSPECYSIVKLIVITTYLKINDNEIFYCSRIAKQKASSVRSRCILVKFNMPRTRDTFLAAVVLYI